jgi:lipid II isoglutaminyl synthase (glutamine-hydrolysing)
MSGTSAVGIVLLFPDLLGTYGDGGNALVLARRLEWRGYDVELIEVHGGQSIPEQADIYVVGGGEDAPQTEAARDIGHDGPLHRAVERGAVVLAVCAGMQIVGRSFPDASGTIRRGAGLLDIETVHVDRPRAVGELLVTPDAELGLPELTGFENHGGRTRLGNEATALGAVETGEGNGWGTEGALNGRVIGTYLHGPVLARNPALADLLLRWTTGDDLEPLDDTEEIALHRERVRAARQRELQPRRSWKDAIRRG